MALNLPGPAACARLREWGAQVVKIEPPSGDPLAQFSPAGYSQLHAGVAIHRVDLKTPEGRAALEGMLSQADVFLTAQRPAALARLALWDKALFARHPRLCHVAITGHAAPHEDRPGHDLTYLAACGLLTPPHMPPTLFADMAGAERAVSATLAAVRARDHAGHGSRVEVPLAAAARWLAWPRDHGLTVPGALLGGGSPGYNLYAASDGWIAVAALEPHFAQRLAQALQLETLDREAVTAAIARNSTRLWVALAGDHDLPLVALPSPS
jgi:crotonobetainyl-CoA:carnitine CoA-transferase CaiB-like acyl-CoA transferase